MTNYEYLVKKHTDYTRRLLVFAIWRSGICPEPEICNVCPLYSKNDRICVKGKQEISDWLKEERKND